jgi:hypothetical protein
MLGSTRVKKRRLKP